MGVNVGVSAVTGAQADNIKLTNKNTTNPRVIIPIFFWQSMPLKRSITSDLLFEILLNQRLRD